MPFASAKATPSSFGCCPRALASQREGLPIQLLFLRRMKMEKEQNTEVQKNEVKEPSSWGWIIPGIIGMILAKTLGLIGALVTIASYFWLQPKLGTLGSILLSAVLGVASGAGATMLVLN